MDALSTPARAYIVTVVTAGVMLAGICLPLAAFDQPIVFFVALVLSCTTAALRLQLPLLEGSRSNMSISDAIDFAALLLIGPHETMIITVASIASERSFNRTAPPLHGTLFRMAALVLAVEGAGLAFRLAGGGATTALLPLARPAALAAAAFFMINTGLVAGVVAVSTGTRFADAWRVRFLWSVPAYSVGAAVAVVTVWVTSMAGYWMAPLTFAPIYLTYRTYRVYMGRIEDEQQHVLETSNLHLATIEALARAIDAKDQTAQSHIRRVQVYAAGLAKAVGLSPDEIQGVKTAALLHDIGKLAVPEHILSKPGPLTQEEFQKIRIHPQIGAEIIAAVPFPYPVAPLILSHHERWDGKGYPHGLAGEDIPVGARILTIVDYYDAVTTERPYHRALDSESAVAMLKHEGGRALDPRLVKMFVELLPALSAEAGIDPQAEAPAAAAAVTDAAAEAHGTGRGTAFENIALAHREIYALYEIAQAMGTSLGVPDTMALISSKLAKLVPWSGCALFLYDDDADLLRCRFAAGVDATRLLNATLGVGHGLSGIVARDRTTLINADPRITFDAAGLTDPIAVRAALVCPLYFEEKFLGCLALYHTTAHHYTEDHRRLLERVAEQAGTVIHNSIVFEQTQEDSLTDPLTGLPNRRSLFSHLSRELARTDRLNGELALIVMDVDGFKGINDRYGHHAGDAALRAIAAELQHALRPYDLCVRYAGDEFIVVLSDCSRGAAEEKRQELQARLSQIDLVVRPGRTIKLGVSAGAAVFPHDGHTYEALLAEADHQMYRDKAARRDEIQVPRLRPPAEFLPRDGFQPASEETAAQENAQPVESR
jgi:diguanylate cyclase (GGDEF)-like protein/putative nucleotidyltransferase with HDIG domain